MIISLRIYIAYEHIYLLYNFQNEVIESFQINKQMPTQQINITTQNISHDFYEGFGIPIQ